MGHPMAKKGVRKRGEKFFRSQETYFPTFSDNSDKHNYSHDINEDNSDDDFDEK